MGATAPLEVLFTGSVPLQPAGTVFEALQRHCGERLRRMPDGEQRNWVFGAWSALTQHPAIEVGEGELVTTADTPFAGLRSPRFIIREGTSPEDVRIERFGLADEIVTSYRQLAELKRKGILIHRDDGIEGARRRIEMASAVLEDFGVGHFCGLRDLNQVGSDGLDDLLELHGEVARL